MKRNLQKFKNNKAFVILFAVTLTAILLSIAMGVASVALKEVKFGTNAHAANEAFSAADEGVECAYFNDKSSNSVFLDTPLDAQCDNNSFQVLLIAPNQWKFVVSGLGSRNEGCVIVIVDKSIFPDIAISSYGYNNGGSNFGVCEPGANTVERHIESNPF